MVIHNTIFNARRLSAFFISYGRYTQILNRKKWNNLQFGRYYASNGNENDFPPDDSTVGAIEVYNGRNLSDGSVSTISIPENLPNLPVVAINRYPLFPGFIKRIEIIKEESLKKLIKQKVELKQQYIAVFVKKDDEDKSEAVTSLSHLYTVGSFAQIMELREAGHLLELIVSAHRRIRILDPLEFESMDVPPPSNAKPRVNGRRTNRKIDKKILKSNVEVPLIETETPYVEIPNVESEDGTERKIIYARTENVTTDPVEKTTEIKAIMQAIVQIIREIVAYSPLFGQQINLLLHPQHNVVDNPIYLCDLVATLVQGAETVDLQAIMQETNIRKRLDLTLELLEKEKTIVKLKHDISKDVEKKIQDQHRKYLLNEQLKAIKKELGIEKDDKQAIVEKFEERLKDLKVPEYAMKVIREEQSKMSYLDPHSSEFSVSRNYLDWLTNIPWGKTSEENNDLMRAKEVLDEDHYGMKDVKDRILEFIAVSILKKSTTGKILLFHGPPGVGKTSIAKSIARALNREYYRFSVGGLYDVAEIKGHRRTYIGAMPGKMIQCLKKVQTENPLVIIDEVDKMGGPGYHGDPASALLELLDPEQNANFLDHFLDVPIDLSKVLFLCTANVLDTIPGPLKDRMEVIEQILIKDEALEVLIKQYCRESGVRNLQKHLEKIFRKAAYKIVGEKENISLPIVVNQDNLVKFVGREKFSTDRLYVLTPPGVIMGLAWTSMGGSALYIEATVSRRFPNLNKNDEHKAGDYGSFESTGHLGEVMKESMRISYTVAKNILTHKDPKNNFLEKAHIHVHVPEGAVPKDGPSAGCTIVSALLSLALNKSAKQDLAMTGEISLTGKILPVGGIKEKVIAAKRAGVSTVILPKENQKDFEDLDDFIRKDVVIHFASHYSEIFDLIFADFQPTN